MWTKIWSKLPNISAGVAFVLASIGLLSGLRALVLVLFALVPLAAGIGILRRRAWSAYGFAFFELGQLALVPLTIRQGSGMPRGQIIFTLALNALLIGLFFLAGRALESCCARRGSPIAWIAVTCLFTLPLLFVRALVMPSAGMEDTILPGDRIAAQVFPHVAPVDDEIIVFHYPIDRRQIYIKRVIGIPGDRIRMAANVVYRNGVALHEPYAVHKFNAPVDRAAFPGNGVPVGARFNPPATAALQDMLRNHVVKGEVVVPAGKYFVLGDNRDNSLDSRHWGLLAASDIMGTPLFVYDSREPTGAHRLRWSRLFKHF
ncbi:MAG TPA: signal peptidase I [Bryobacteraceae bacterium]|nr:signal peptidase I [Bryobacteraceae bacterium]